MLKGTLDTFSAGELLWLIGRTRATGVLHVLGPTSGAIWCREGFVTWATLDDRLDVLDLLASAGVIPNVIDRVAATDQVEAEMRGGPESGRIHDIVRSATEDAVYEMAAWGEGEAAFTVGPQQRFAHAFSYPVASMLDEVRRRRARWDALMAAVGGPDHVIVPAAGGADDGELTISRAQWRLLSHVDGRRSVRAIAEATGLGLFATAERLGDLVRAGLVEIREPRAEPVPAALPGPLPAREAAAAEPPRPVDHAPPPAAPLAPSPVPAVNGRHLAAVPSPPDEIIITDWAIAATAGPLAAPPVAPVMPAAPAALPPEPVPAPAIDPLDRVLGARDLGLPEADYVDANDTPSRELILRLLAAVKEI